jgi:Cu-Zn family superoxide dismutase
MKTNHHAMKSLSLPIIALAIGTLALRADVKNPEATFIIKNPVEATAEFHGLSDSKITGTVTFTKVDGGTHIVAEIKGLSPGKHGFHVHEKGDCSKPDGSSAGGHFNPTKSLHGGPDDAVRHVGDLGNIEADGTGLAKYDRVDKLITLEGDNSVVGRGIMIHAKEDDLKSQPAGESGARIACGEIKAVK